MEFSKKTEIVEGKENIQYYINDKPVDEKTYLILKDDDYCRDYKLPKIKKNKPVKKEIKNKSKQSITTSKDFDIWIKKIFDNVMTGKNNKEKIKILKDEILVIITDAYVEGEIDICKVYIDNFKENCELLEKSIEDLFE